MAVCRYFLQGNCWYGENCRFEHPRNTYNEFNQPNQFAALTPHSGTGQPNRGGRPGGAGGGTSTNVKDLATDDIINIISQEMAQWEQTHMWQFSCFSYTKETSCLPGLEDMSHEEVRLKAYEAQKAGTFDSYKQWIAQLTSDYKAKKKELINPSPHMRIKLKEVINTLKAAAPGCVASESVKGTFGFGQGFGTPGSQFSGATGDGTHSQSLVGSSQSNAAFSGSPATNQNTALFGATSQPGGFGGGTNTFGSSGSGLFGKPTPTAAASGVFGGGVAASQQSGGLFGKPPATTQTSTFGGAQPIFGGSAGAFGGSTSSAFGTAPPGGALQNSSGAVTQNLFGAAPQGAFGSAQTSFGGASQTTQPSSVASSLYTPLEKLTAEERAQFEAATFSLGKIPTRPPPRELV